MTVQEALAELEAAGTDQNRKIYRRHGVRDPLFGVSHANLRALVKRIKVDQPLAEQLWATGNHDARVLATMIADPRHLTEPLAEQWATTLDNYVLTDALADLIGRSTLTRMFMERWTDSPEEWRGRAGWHLLARLAMADPALPDDFFAPYLTTIEREIHGLKNRVRDAMNNALIAIGIRDDALERQAVAVAERIGTVQVDHGQTNCKTPAAAAYIAKVRQRRQAPPARASHR
jgi:3-methyladenine DNA glycosylase AlkD